MGLAGVCVIIFFLPFTEFPEGAFRRVVADPIPASIQNIRARGSGGTQLAGGSDFVSFELSADDFPKILARHKFVEKRSKDLIRIDGIDEVRIFPAVENPTYFQASYLQGKTTYTIKTNSSRTVVHYSRDRM